MQRALAAGATDAECTIAEGDEFSANVRMRELENLKEAGSRGAGLRILRGKHTGSSYTSDLSPGGHRAHGEIGRRTGRYHHGRPARGPAGLPRSWAASRGDLGLYSPDVAGLETGLKIESAKRAEEAALSADPRIFNSEGASFDTHVGRHVFANSRGFAGEYRSSYCSLSAVPVARDGESMERDYWYTMARDFRGLEPAADVGRKAAARALRRLNPVKVATQKVPVVFDRARPAPCSTTSSKRSTACRSTATNRSWPENSEKGWRATT